MASRYLHVHLHRRVARAFSTVRIYCVFSLQVDSVHHHSQSRGETFLAREYCSSIVQAVSAGSFNWFMTSRPLLQAGMMSYSIYLCHPMALRIVHSQIEHDRHPENYSLLGLLACVYALALLFGFLGQYLVETPFIKLGSLLSRRLSALIDPVRRGTPLLVT